MKTTLKRKQGGYFLSMADIPDNFLGMAFWGGVVVR